MGVMATSDYKVEITGALSTNIRSTDTNKLRTNEVVINVIISLNNFQDSLFLQLKCSLRNNTISFKIILLLIGLNKL